MFAIGGEPRIFFMVDVEKISSGKQVCYDYQDHSKYHSSDNLNWLKEDQESSDDEGMCKILRFVC